ncbi:M48 family metallopeptidase [Paenibacillus sp. EPM92]|uniref:M48 family metallopeptidase n=1 Tax=Paenibacillus sp. EPM92 TaxID=1561195 RepID=UPI001915EBAB|nr:M48 family metallopeptidase [Paenibacillus sp. EPM92]
MQAQTSWRKKFAVAFIIYAAAIGLYLAAATIHPIPEAYRGTAADPATFLDPAKYRQSLLYSAQRNWIFFISYPWEWAVYLYLLFSRKGAAWQSRLEQSPKLRKFTLPLFVLLLQGFVFLCFLPLRVLSYMLSRTNGISTQGWGSWLQDRAVDFGVNYVLIVIVASVAFLIMRKGGRWWLKLWLLSIPFTLFMMYIQPVVIDPLYNQFNRLSDPQLEAKILSLADKAHIPAERVYEVDMSEKTNALNAYVSGIGGSLRIVLWDTTLQRLNEPEILLIMAHEMGHYVKHHLEWSAIGAVGSSFVLLWAGSFAIRRLLKRYGDDWGIRRLHEPAALPAVLLLISVLTFVSLPVSNAVSRQAEHAADIYAFQLIGSKEGAVTMYQKLAESSLSEMNPPLLVKLFRSTHPSLMDRILYSQDAP